VAAKFDGKLFGGRVLPALVVGAFSKSCFSASEPVVQFVEQVDEQRFKMLIYREFGC